MRRLLRDKLFKKLNKTSKLGTKIEQYFIIFYLKDRRKDNILNIYTYKVEESKFEPDYDLSNLTILIFLSQKLELVEIFNLMLIKFLSLRSTIYLILSKYNNQNLFSTIQEHLNKMIWISSN
jgi:hypothetical protein